VSDIKGGNYAENIEEQGAEENIWNKKNEVTGGEVFMLSSVPF
jgi:hypothetical protein